MWIALDVSWEWTADGMIFHCVTDVPCFLYLHFTLVPPVKLPVYREQRGMRTFCGYRYRVRGCRIFHQAEDGLQYTHSFSVTGWPACNPAWWYLRGYTGVGWSGSQSLLYTDHRPLTADPWVPPVRAIVCPHTTIARNGNHYTFWAQGTWYCVVPSENWIEVYKWEPPDFVRKDFAHQPAAFGGQFSDCDARLSLDGSYIHIAYAWRNALFPPDYICYAYFDCLADTWGTAVYPAAITTNRPSVLHCSLARDTYDTVHIIFIYSHIDPCRVAYVTNYGGAWGPLFTFLSTWINAPRYTTAAWGPDDIFHGAATSVHYHLLYNSRPLGGPTGVQERVAASSNVHRPSLAVRADYPALAFFNTSVRLDYASKVLGAWGLDSPDLDTFTWRFPNLLIPPQEPYTPNVLILNHLGRLRLLRYYHPDWIALTPTDQNYYTRLAATLNGPSTVSWLSHDDPYSPNTYFNALRLPD